MKNLKNNKTLLITLIVIALVVITFGLTYAYWLVTKTQTNTNTITAACLDIELVNESNDITLVNQYPISYSEGMRLTPYTFTVRNKCNVAVTYQVALESIGNASTAIGALS